MKTPAIALFLMLATLLHSAAAVAADSTAAQCAALAGDRFVKLPGAPTWVVKALWREATAQRRSHCEVEGYVNPTSNFGMYLPGDNWNGKFMVRGCGGSCGQVATEGACGRHLRDGYACLHTDMGHRSTQIDNNWVENNLQGLVDFGYRATHTTTLAGKAIAEAFYSTAPKRAYFYGCSTGGRQALIEAQRFPADFDGIVAVAPVSIRGFGLTPPRPAAVINRDAAGNAILTDLQVPSIYRAVMARCDLNDGVRDGLVDPRDCQFDPVELKCKTGNTDPRSCLTAAQIEVARQFYAIGAAPGSELNWINNWTAAPGPAREFLQSRGDPALVDTLNNSGNPDLRAFKARGGRLILAHGTTDLQVPYGPTQDYYELATRAMGGPGATQEFFRFFVIPGMDHCSGGDGAWAVNYVSALDAWVERGEAPWQLLGVHPTPGAGLDYFALDLPLLTAMQIEFTRPYFPYPQRAYYSGRGDPRSAGSFVPALQPRRRQSAPADMMPAPVGTVVVSTLARLMADSENQYLISGLPPKNVSDRIGKAARLYLYNSGAGTTSIRAALMELAARDLTPITREAVQRLIPEYAP